MAADSIERRNAPPGSKRWRNVPAIAVFFALIVLTMFAGGRVASSHAGVIQWPVGAKELEQKRDYQALLDYSRKWISGEITNPQAWYFLGVAHYKLGQFPNAADAFRESVRLQPDDARAWDNLGVACDDLSQFSNAVNAYKEAIRLNARYSSSWYNLGVAYSNLKPYPAAMDAFREAQRLTP